MRTTTGTQVDAILHGVGGYCSVQPGLEGIFGCKLDEKKLLVCSLPIFGRLTSYLRCLGTY